MGKDWGRSLAELASTRMQLDRAERDERRASTRNGIRSPPPTRPGSNAHDAHARSASYARRPPSSLSARTASGVSGMHRAGSPAPAAQADDIAQVVRDELRGAHVSSRAQLRSELRAGLDSALDTSFRASLDGSLETALETALASAFGDLAASLRDEVRDEIRASTRDALRDDKANWTMKTEWAARKRGYNDALHEMADPATAAGNMHCRLVREAARDK